MTLRKRINSTLAYIVLVIVGVVIIYPFLWLVGSSFKTTYEIFAEPGIIPHNPTFNAYINGWKGGGTVAFDVFFKNTFFYAILKVIFTVFSATITAYGFTRFEFPFRKPLQAILIGTLLFPAVVVIVPSYIIFARIGWSDSYYPLLVPALLAGETYFVYLLMQFFRTIPREMDEAAMIDGCGPVKRLFLILVPLIKPSVVTVVLFQFIWACNDFLNPMIYLSTETKFPVSVGLKMTMDSSAGLIKWENIFAMSVLAILPPLVLFILAQRNFIEGISTSGLKG